MKEKNLLVTLLIFIAIIFGCNKNESQLDDSWTYLFDGKTFTGWKMYGVETDSISPKWEIENGTIIASKNGDGPGINTGFDESLMTIEPYDNFELELEFKNSEGGNSGVMYHVVEDSTIPMDYYTGHEYQILDDYYFEGKVREFQLTASVFGLFAAGPKTLNPAGEWNQVRIKVEDGNVEHWLNGALILEFDRNSDDYLSTYQESQWTQFPDWGKSQKGHITLQDHGDRIEFRNIRIKKL